jgi:transposase
MNPYPAKHSVLVLDNCCIHHVEGVEEMCAEAYVILPNTFQDSNPFTRGVKLVFLPPYSPDLNPIEECFSYIKSYISRHGEAFRNVVELGDEADPLLFLYGVLETVTPEASKGWFSHSGY